MLDDIETKLQSPRTENLKKDIEALKNKSEANRQMAREAQEAAQAALNATDTGTVRQVTARLLTDY